jgi:hypothetical protein
MLAMAELSHIQVQSLDLMLVMAEFSQIQVQTPTILF